MFKVFRPYLGLSYGDKKKFKILFFSVISTFEITDVSYKYLLIRGSLTSV